MLLRGYQEGVVEETRAAMARHKRILICSPTGSGKTVLASFMLNSAAQKGKRCWFIVHRNFLTEQTALTFEKAGIPFGIIAAGFPQNPYAKIQICSIDTVKNRLDRVAAPDLIVWDECHHLGAAGWQAVQNAFSAAWHVGITATPIRTDGKGLGRWFSHLVKGPSVRWLIENGHLSDYKLFAPSTPNLDGVHTRAGDYVTAEIDEIMRGRAIIGNCVRNWQKLAPGLLTIGFATSIQASQERAAAFRAAGIRAIHVDGTLSRHDRKLASLALANREVEVMWCSDLVGEGYDLSAQAGRDVPIEAVIMDRPTQSEGLYLQQGGRALRPKPRPAVIIDNAGNSMRHGLFCDERDWTLEDRKNAAKGDSEAAFPTRQCPKCYAVHRPSPTCTNCGHRYVTLSRQLEEIAADLKEIDIVAQRRARLAEQSQAQTLDQLIELGKKRGYKHPERWAAHLVSARLAGR